MQNFNYFFIISVFFLISCAGHMEDRINQDFKSLQPDYTNIEEKKSLEGTIYEGDGGLFASDRRATRVGDIITISLAENLTANNGGTATLNKSQDYTFDLPAAIFGPSSLIGKLFFKDGINEANLSTANSAENMSSTAATAQTLDMTATISVTVVRRFPNGNLEIKGSKKLQYKNGTEYIRVSGTIRPEDIDATNTVSSLKVADAEISVVGSGDVTNVATKGWLAKAFSYVKPF
tara:strand:+ start:213 stop:914 length:702 start_codon:yes stop_codon:yes gene_type:complete